jgi:tetratricopeptide (TPR) repeat protein
MLAARVLPLLLVLPACGSGNGVDAEAAALALREGHALLGEVRGPEDGALVERALVAFERATRLAPADFEALYWAGRAAALRNHAERAAGYLRRAVEVDPEHADAWRRLGAQELAGGRPAEARAALGRARALGEESAELYYDLGRARQETDDAPGAQAAFRAALERRPAWPQPYFGLANLLRRAGDEDGAARAMSSFQRWTGLHDRAEASEKRARARPQDAELCEAAGIALYGVRELERSAQWLERALALEEARSRAHYFRGLLYHEDGALDDAREHLERAVALDPTNAAPRRELAWVHASAGRTDAALRAMQESVGRADGDAGAHRELGTLCLQLGRDADALAAFERALELDATHVDAHLGAAQAQYQLGDKHGAREHWQSVLALEPGHPGAVQSLEVLAREGVR